MKCCSCDGPITESHVGGVQVFRCTNCCGDWVSFKSMELLSRVEGIDAGIQQLLSESGAGERDCPSCASVKLRKARVDEVELDVCPECRGVFFDEREIEAVFPRTSEWQKNDGSKLPHVVQVVGELVVAVVSSG